MLLKQFLLAPQDSHPNNINHINFNPVRLIKNTLSQHDNYIRPLIRPRNPQHYKFLLKPFILNLSPHTSNHRTITRYWMNSHNPKTSQDQTYSEELDFYYRNLSMATAPSLTAIYLESVRMLLTIARIARCIHTPQDTYFTALQTQHPSQHQIFCIILQIGEIFQVRS